MNIDELNLILQEGEGYNIEFKENVNSDLPKEMTAMANSSGGRILIGINDCNKITGTATDNSTISKILNFAAGCDPSVDINIEKLDNMLIVNVKEGVNKPYRCSKGFYIRNGANSQKLTTREITGFIQEEGKVRFDELLRTDIEFQKAYSPEELNKYLALAGISKTIDDISILSNLGCLQLKNQLPILNNAGILFFAKKPINYLFHSIVTCALYKGNDKVVILDRKDFSDNIIENIENTILFLKQHLNLRYEITSLKEKKYLRYLKLQLEKLLLMLYVIVIILKKVQMSWLKYLMIELLSQILEVFPKGLLQKNLAKLVSLATR